MISPMSLTAKQQRFVEEYLVDLNATKAALRAGYSPKTARAQGSSLLTKLDIAQAITEAKKRRSERTQVEQDDVVRGLLRIARALEVDKGNLDGVPIKTADRVKAWELVGRHLGMFDKPLKVEHSGRIDTREVPHTAEEARQILEQLRNE